MSSPAGWYPQPDGRQMYWNGHKYLATWDETVAVLNAPAIFCGSCGKNIGGNRFCGGCGSAQPPATQSVASLASVVDGSEPSIKKLNVEVMNSAPDAEPGVSPAGLLTPKAPLPETESYPTWAPARAEDGTLSAQARKNIAGYKKTTTLLCLECGYNGLMGVIRTVKPWWGRWPLIICVVFILAMLNVVVSGLFAVLWGLAAAASERHVCMCPQCHATIQ